MLRLIAVTLFAVCSAEYAMQFKDCGSHGATLSAVVATECNPSGGETICSVHRGSDYKGYVNFTATHDSNEAHAILHGGLGFLSVPWPVTPANACHGSIVPGCPLKAGQTYTYKLDMHCPTIAPAGARVSAKWELKDEHRRDILCFVIPIKIE